MNAPRNARTGLRLRAELARRRLSRRPFVWWTHARQLIIARLLLSSVGATRQAIEAQAARFAPRGNRRWRGRFPRRRDPTAEIFLHLNGQPLGGQSRPATVLSMDAGIATVEDELAEGGLARYRTSDGRRVDALGDPTPWDFWRLAIHKETP